MQLKNILCLIVVMVGSLIPALVMAQPTTNPYKDRYPWVAVHWTDSLPWQRTWDVTVWGAFPNDNLEDDQAIKQAADSLSTLGGGVLYFPPGAYHFTQDLLVPNGVILRGATPTGVTDAREVGYLPPSRLEFPAYQFDPQANGGRGYANNTAFKRIRAANGLVSNAGVVNLDINRAGISFGTQYGIPAGWPIATPIALNRNIIVLGTRTNNVASPTSTVPDSSFQHKWQRHMNIFTNNIGVFVGRNAAVCNNRCNDIAGTGGQDDSFEQDGYIVKKWPFTGYDTLTVGKAWFRYTDHYGIAVNRKGAPTSATPEQEPSMFADGLEVNHNWVYHTMRVGIYFTGLNTQCVGNVIRDNPQKVAWVHTNGLEVPKNSNTLENRGIDVSGWGAVVDSNDVAVYRHRINAGPFYSVDGEGILHQACCGGTSVNGYRIRDNVTHGAFISVFYSDHIHNVQVQRNNLGGPLKTGSQTGGIIWINSDVSNNQPAYLNNVLVEDNYNIDNNSGMGSIITGSKGGHATIVRNNAAQVPPSTAPGPDLRISCHVQESNNTDFSAVIITNNGGIPCAPPADLPLANVVWPSQDTSYCDSLNHQLMVKIKLHYADLNSCTVDLYQGNVIAYPNLIPDPDSTVSVWVSLPTASGTTSFTARARQSGNTSFSNSVRVTKDCPIRNTLTSLAPSATKPKHFLYPQPARSTVTLSGISLPESVAISIVNMLGQEVGTALHIENGSLSLPSLSSGVYYLNLRTGAVKLMVEQ